MDTSRNGFNTIYGYPPDSSKMKDTISESLTNIDEILMNVDDVCKRIREQEDNSYEQTKRL